MKRLDLFFLLAFLLVASFASAQEGNKTEEAPAVSAPVSNAAVELKLPETSKDALELQQQIQAKLAAIPVDAVDKKDLRAAHDAQVQRLGELAKELARLETFDARREELLKRKAEADKQNRTTPDVVVPEYSWKNKIEEIQKDLDEAKLKVEQVQRDFEEAKTRLELLRKDKDLSSQIAVMTTTINEKKENETKAEASLREGRQTGVDVPLLEELLFKSRLERAVLVQRRAVLEKEQTIGWPQLLEDVALAEMAFQRRMLDQWTERRDAIGRALAARKNRKAGSALQDAKDLRGTEKNSPRYKYHDLTVSALTADQKRAALQTEESERAAYLGSIGDQRLLKEEADELHQSIVKTRDGEEDSDLPESFEKLDEKLTMARTRHEGARKASQYLRKSLAAIREDQKAAKYEKDQLGTRVRLARADVRNGSNPAEKPDGQEVYTDQDWIDRETQLNTALNNLISEQNKQAENIKTLLADWESLEDVSQGNIEFLVEKLRWTRSEYKISLDSLKDAALDAGKALRQFPERAAAAWSVVVDEFTAKEQRARIIVVGVVFLALGFILWRLRRRLPKTYVWIEEQTKSGSQFFKVLGIYLRRTDLGLLIALFMIGGPLAAGMGRVVILTSLCLFATPFLYQLGRATLDIFFLPGSNEVRFLDMEERLAELLHRAGGWMIKLAVFFLPIGYLMEIYGYDRSNPGFVELWWLVFGTLSQIVLLLSIFRPIVVKTIIRGQNIFAVSLKNSILLGYPLVVGGMIYLFLLHSLHYDTARQFFQEIIFKSLGLLLGSYVLYRIVLRAVLRNRDVGLRLNVEDFESEEAYHAAGRNLLAAESLLLVIRLTFLVPVLFLLASFWEPVSFSWATASLTGDDGISLLDIVEAVLVIYLTMKLIGQLRSILIFAILPQTKLDRGLRYTVLMLMTYGLWTIGFVVALQLMKVRGEHIAYFTGALAFGIGFGLQSIVKNFVSGLILLVERPVKIGDMVEVEGRSGSIEKITLRATTVMTYDGIGVVIPNELMIGGSITNYSLGHPRLRSTLAVGVAYGSDIQRVRKILTEVINSHGLVLKRPEPESFFIGFGDSSLDFQVLFWTNLTTHRPRTLSDLRFALDAAFRREKIEIPFPQRDLNIRTVDGTVVAAFGGAELPRPGDGGALDSKSGTSDQAESSPKSSS